MQLESTLTCPNCAHQSTEKMPTVACQCFYDCKGCGHRLKPKQAIVACFVLTARCRVRRFKRTELISSEIFAAPSNTRRPLQPSRQQQSRPIAVLILGSLQGSRHTVVLGQAHLRRISPFLCLLLHRHWNRSVLQKMLLKADSKNAAMQGCSLLSRLAGNIGREFRF
jgi:hypothetical protein